MFRKVDCQWDDWRESECSAECGGGILTKTRSKKVEAAHGGAQCSGLSSMEEDCNTQNCPGLVYIHTYKIIESLID